MVCSPSGPLTTSSPPRAHSTLGAFIVTLSTAPCSAVFSRILQVFGCPLKDQQTSTDYDAAYDQHDCRVTHDGSDTEPRNRQQRERPKRLDHIRPRVAPRYPHRGFRQVSIQPLRCFDHNGTLHGPLTSA